MCKLKKSLYGLKQSPRAWFEHFDKVIKHYGYTQSQADHTMFYKHSNEGIEIKDLGALKYFLGMEFARSKEGIFVKSAEPTKAKNVKEWDHYQRLVGRLIYLSHTRPDIAFSVSMVSQFMHVPGPEHLKLFTGF
ncbi:hypothetical protein CK203_037829 [Vitis vinifera]|uniref:Reverse transcriptase Ty1/copia-type domain-containing protein n=1 Tax=Vitis vinifera TaxID=29760 RepID=A0A438IH91_VITVI|nr:hypothetical protein CK203_037829 [Vitis vinifera]